MLVFTIFRDLQKDTAEWDSSKISKLISHNIANFGGSHPTSQKCCWILTNIGYFVSKKSSKPLGSIWDPFLVKISFLITRSLTCTLLVRNHRLHSELQGPAVDPWPQRAGDRQQLIWAAAHEWLWRGAGTCGGIGPEGPEDKSRTPFLLMLKLTYSSIHYRV